MTTSAPPAPLPLPNFRDLGGWPTGSTTVITAQVFRSAQPGRDAEATLAEAGIRCLVDLRTAAERAAEPDPASPALHYLVCDVLRDAPTAPAAQLGESGFDPASLAAFVRDGQAQAMLTATYRQFVSLDSAQLAYRALFLALADDDARPLLFHCTAGKDRTGWAAAALLLLLGVDYDDVLTDYLRTNDNPSSALEPFLQQLHGLGLDDEHLRPLVGVDRSYLDAALDEVDTRFGSIEAYFRDGLGLGGDVIAGLRSRLLA